MTVECVALTVFVIVTALVRGLRFVSGWVDAEKGAGRGQGSRKAGIPGAGGDAAREEQD